MGVADHAPPTIDPIIESLLGSSATQSGGLQAPSQGAAPSGHLVELLRQLRDHLLGSARIIPCDASGTNLITITPNNPISPIMEAYVEHDCFAFVAGGSSSGAVTAVVVSRDGGNMGTLKVYKTAGSAQAGNGDVVSGLFYLAFFVSSLDSGNGGFVLK